jgi:hypothetical protein
LFWEKGLENSKFKILVRDLLNSVRKGNVKFDTTCVSETFSPIAREIIQQTLRQASAKTNTHTQNKTKQIHIEQKRAPITRKQNRRRKLWSAIENNDVKRKRAKMILKNYD